MLSSMMPESKSISVLMTEVLQIYAVRGKYYKSMHRSADHFQLIS
jgi:hypothetical protein